jgi:hypothetical protein
MHPSIGRRLAGATLVAMLAGAASASSAAAQARCTAPDEPGWHSCLTASHRTTDGGEQIHLTKVRPRLVIRYADGCPEGAGRRTVAIRTEDGDRLGRTTVRSRCRRGVARYDAPLRLDVDLPEGTVVRSFWSGIADNRTAPAVELKGS